MNAPRIAWGRREQTEVGFVLKSPADVLNNLITTSRNTTWRCICEALHYIFKHSKICMISCLAVETTLSINYSCLQSSSSWATGIFLTNSYTVNPLLPNAWCEHIITEISCLEWGLCSTGRHEGLNHWDSQRYCHLHRFRSKYISGCH